MGVCGRGWQDGKRVLDCLQRALKIADVCMQASTNVHLFVEILNRYLFYLEAGNEKINIKYIQVHSLLFFFILVAHMKRALTS